MTSDNTPKPKGNPWVALVQLAIVLALLLGFMWGVTALIKWA